MPGVTEEADENKFSSGVDAQGSGTEEGSLSIAGQARHENRTHTRKFPRPTAKEALAQMGGRDNSAGEATVLPRYT